MIPPPPIDASLARIRHLTPAGCGPVTLDLSPMGDVVAAIGPSPILAIGRLTALIDSLTELDPPPPLTAIEAAALKAIRDPMATATGPSPEAALADLARLLDAMRGSQGGTAPAAPTAPSLTIPNP